MRHTDPSLAHSIAPLVRLQVSTWPSRHACHSGLAQLDRLCPASLSQGAADPFPRALVVCLSPWEVSTCLFCHLPASPRLSP